jgi:outer membrane lipoprotein carrier protein
MLAPLARFCSGWLGPYGPGIFFVVVINLTSLLPAYAKDAELESSIDALQKKYSRVSDLRADFIQNYSTSRRPPRTETGVLYLRRPGMMRWEYQSPIEKLFISDGKDIYFFLPEERQVQKTMVKESRDQRLPFLFLLGRGNLKKDFSKVEWANDQKAFFAGNRVLYAFPKKNIDEFSKVLMEFDPRNLQLQRVTIYDIDGSTSEFVFTNIKENTGLRAQMFSFKVPPNVEVLGPDALAGQ